MLRRLFVQFANFTNLFLLFQQHLLVLLHEVFPALKLLVVVRIRIVYFLFNLNRARPLEVGVPHAVKVRVHHCVFGRDAEVRVELKHICKQLDSLGIRSLKQVGELVLVLVDRDHVKVLHGCLVGDKRLVCFLGRANNSAYVLQLIFRAYLELLLTFLISPRVQGVNLALSCRRQRIARGTWQQYLFLR